MTYTAKAKQLVTDNLPTSYFEKQRWHGAKMAAGIGLAAADGGFNAAGYISGEGVDTGEFIFTASEALAVGQALCLTPAGIVFLTADVAIRAITVYTSGVSTLKSHRHEMNLRKIRDNFSSYGCFKKHSQAHQNVKSVIDYAIMQKRTKKIRKGLVAGSLGFYESAEKARATSRNVWKRMHHNLGLERRAFAEQLATHFRDCYCQAADAVIAELWSEEAMKLMVGLPTEDITKLIMLKLKSV